MINFIADTECILQDTFKEEDEQQIIRKRICNTIHNHIVRNDKNMDMNDKKLNHEYQRAKSFIYDVNKNTDESKRIYIIRSDKGNRTTIMNQNTYHKEMTEIVNNKLQFRVCRRNPINDIQKELISCIDKMIKKNYIDEKEKVKLIEKYPSTPRIYGLPKIHKMNDNNRENNKIPLRTITSFINSPLYKLSKYLSDILIQPESVHKYNIKNSYEAADKLHNYRLPNGYILVSLDVVSLFPSVPLTLIVRAIDKHWDEIKNYTKIAKLMFIDLIQLCYKNSFCQYNNQCYRQIFGLPMGSPLSCILADYVMNDIMTDIFEKITENIDIKFKYVDDLLLSIPEDKVDDILNKFNNYNKFMKFTIETEKNGEIPYLDMLVKRNENQKIEISWYKKPIASGRILNYLSTHPIMHKINTALGLIHRIYSLDKNSTDENKNKNIMNHLKNNNYPPSLIKILIRRFKNKKRMNLEDRTNNDVIENSKYYRSIPYIKNLSEKVAKFLKNNKKDLHLTYSNKKCDLYSRLKDKTDIKQLKNVIYSIKCEDRNCKKEYIGMTTTSLQTRIYNHNSDINKANNNTNNFKAQQQQKTALIQHMIDNKHNFDTNKVKVLDTNKSNRKLVLLESLHIQGRIENTVNMKTDTHNIKNDYKTILHLMNKRKKFLAPNSN
jgi:hypothetical protein